MDMDGQPPPYPMRVPRRARSDNRPARRATPRRRDAGAEGCPALGAGQVRAAAEERHGGLAALNFVLAELEGIAQRDAPLLDVAAPVRPAPRCCCCCCCCCCCRRRRCCCCCCWKIEPRGTSCGGGLRDGPASGRAQTKRLIEELGATAVRGAAADGAESGRGSWASVAQYRAALEARRAAAQAARTASLLAANARRCAGRPLFGADLIRLIHAIRGSAPPPPKPSLLPPPGGFLRPNRPAHEEGPANARGRPAAQPRGGCGGGSGGPAAAVGAHARAA
jgi:hypothetical protein